MERVLCSFNADGNVYFISTEVRGSRSSTTFCITLIEAASLSAWQGEFGDDNRSHARLIDMDVEDYVDHTRKALTRQDIGDLSFEYQVKPSKGNGRDLSWKKVIPSIKFQLGRVSLKPVTSSPDTMKDILLHAIRAAADLKSSIYRLETENDRLSNERTQALKRLEKCVEQKEKMESDLYSKFAVILNEKKAKIRELKERGTGREVANRNRRGPGDDQSNDGADVEEEMDVDDDEIDTDEEREKDVTSRKQKRVVAPSSRPAPDDFIVFEEESLDAPTSKARRRRREPQMKKTSSTQKPNIPKVPSTGTPSASRAPSTSGTPTARKTSTSRSLRSTQSDNVDDLLEHV